MVPCGSALLRSTPQCIIQVQDFRRKVLRELKKIKIAWPELHYSTAKGVLILSPSPSHRQEKELPPL